MRLPRRRRTRILLAAVGAVALVWISGVRLFAFPGESMSPTVGLWHLRAPERFDLAIYDVPPKSKWAERKIPWMKRVVGLPGEHVRLTREQLFIDGRKVDTPFLHRDGRTSAGADFEIRLGRDEYCILGDNLDHSFDDSRSMGPIPRSLMRGFVVSLIQGSSATVETGKSPAPASTNRNGSP
jgi:signal peptidase I